MSDSYWRLIWRDAVDHWRGETFENWGRRMIGYLAESAALFLVLYFLPVLGDVQGEARLATAGAASLIVGALALFLWDLVTSPKRVHAKVMARLQERHEIIADMWKAERGLRVLAALHAEGMAIYMTVEPLTAFINHFDAWDARVKAILAERFSVSDLFKYENEELGIVWYKVPNSPSDEWDNVTQEVRCKFTKRLKALHDLVEFGGGAFLGGTLAIRDMLKSEADRNLTPLTPLLRHNPSPKDGVLPQTVH